MAINIKFDLSGNPELPTIILANRSGNKLGKLDINIESVELKDKFNGASEIAFTLNKYIDEKITNLWDDVVDFKLVYCKEWDTWFEIKVELDETIETVKTVYCTQLGQAELSQIMLYNIEINTEADIERDDYKMSILYDADSPESSILHRLLKDKAPHYSIAYVSPTIARIQRSFSFDDVSICDAFNEIAEEIGCLFVYNSNSDANGMPQRTVSVYDLQQNCNNCGYRGEFIDSCPKCDSSNIKNGYGDDTLIFVTSDELATEGIELVTDTDSVKNCFKLEAGDDLMTATVRSCNPNGTDYIWYFSDSIKEDMSGELVDRIESYNELYKHHYNDYVSVLDAKLLNDYNALANKYSIYNKNIQPIDTPIVGYKTLMNAYYNTIDLALYLQSGLMPSLEMSDTNAEKQAALLTSASLSPVAVSNIETVSLSTANSTVLAMAKTIIKPAFRVQVNNSELSPNKTTWTGNFVVTNYSDDEDTYVSDTISINISGNNEMFIRQKVDKILNKENTDDYSISNLFEKEYDDFCNELKKYALNPLSNFREVCQSCIDILIGEGAGSASGLEPNLYEDLYTPYYRKLMAIESEIKVREDEINIISGIYDIDGNSVTKGLQSYIEDCKDEIRNALDFENYLGEKLWLEFCSYRRDDKYSNENYISDGLNNLELFEKALEFIEVAENEIYKSSELQHSISTTLNNLLAIPKFKPLVKSFKSGNWIRVRVDDCIYKLRLIEYSISYGDFNNIPVKFSDVIKIKNGISDIESILSQASSMSSSYDSVKRQSKQGDEAQSTIEQWLTDGLNSALVQIQNNVNEEITITKNGLLGRSYNDITETYSPKQIKLTHNILAFTDNDWESVRLAIGEHKYISYDDNDNRVTKVGYGLSADFVTAGVVSGSQIIGGDIYSDNYSKTESTGSYLNLRDGTFSFGGGSLRYENGKLIISSKTADTNITEINEEWLKTTYVYAENLEVNSAKIQGKLTASQIETDGLIAENIYGTAIDGKTITGGSLLIGDKSSNTYAEIDTDGKLTCSGANIKGDVVATSLTLGDGVKISSDDIEGLDVDTIIFKGDITQTIEKDSNGIEYTLTSVPVSDGNTITYSTYSADDYMVFGRSRGEDSEGKDYISISKNGLLIARNAWIYGTVYATDGEFTGDIVANSLTLNNDMRIGDDENGYHTWISTDGVLNAYGGTFSGTVTASTIVGSEIIGGSLSIGNSETGYSAWISSDDGIFHAQGAIIDGEIHVSNGGTVGGFTIADALISGDKRTCNDGKQGVYVGTDGISCGSNFSVDKDGFVSVSGGFLNAGDWTLSGGGLILIDRPSQEYLFDLNRNGMTTKYSPDSELKLFWSLDDSSIAFGSQHEDGSSAAYILFYGSASLNGTWISDACLGTSSDANLKNSISAISNDERYDAMFDALIPSMYKYNNGTSNRMHTGYIAQEVLHAMEIAGLSTNEFAGYIKDSTDTCYLRYDEFVPLNTHQIQRLKHRVSSIEEYMNTIEERIEQLEKK